MWRADTFIPTELYIRRLHSRAIKVNAPSSLVDDRDEKIKKKFPLQVQQLEACYRCGCPGCCGGFATLRRVTRHFFSSPHPVFNEARRLSRAHQRDTSCKTFHLDTLSEGSVTPGDVAKQRTVDIAAFRSSRVNAKSCANRAGAGTGGCS